MGYIILGAGGHAKVIIDIIQSMDRSRTDSLQQIKLLDDNLVLGTQVSHCEVVGKIDDCYKFSENNRFIIGIGNNFIRRRLAKTYNLPYFSAVHPAAVIGNGVCIGLGTVIMAGVVINSESIIGRHCIINTGSTIDHENEIEDFVHISPGVHTGGNVRIGKGSWIGIGASVKNSVLITSEVVIGVGSIVINNIESSGIYVGNPVRKIKDESIGLSK